MKSTSGEVSSKVIQRNSTPSIPTTINQVDTQQVTQLNFCNLAACLFQTKICFQKKTNVIIAETPVFCHHQISKKAFILNVLKLSTFPCHLSRAATFPTCNFPSFMVITSKITCGVVEVGFVGVIIVDQKIAKYYIIEPCWDWNI